MPFPAAEMRQPVPRHPSCLTAKAELSQDIEHSKVVPPGIAETDT